MNSNGKQASEQIVLTVDLSINHTSVTQIANCIMARENREICNVQGVGNGVVTVITEEQIK